MRSLLSRWFLDVFTCGTRSANAHRPCSDMLFLGSLQKNSASPPSGTSFEDDDGIAPARARSAVADETRTGAVLSQNGYGLLCIWYDIAIDMHDNAFWKITYMIYMIWFTIDIHDSIHNLHGMICYLKIRFCRLLYDIAIRHTWWRIIKIYIEYQLIRFYVMLNEKL